MYPSGSCHGLLARVFGVLAFDPSTRKIRGAQGTACLAVRPRVGTGCPVGAGSSQRPVMRERRRSPGGCDRSAEVSPGATRTKHPVRLDRAALDAPASVVQVQLPVEIVP